jgi:excisionase family DNA binding protein
MAETDLLTTKEVATLLDLSAGRIRQLAQRGFLPAKHVGRDWVFSRKEIAKYADPVNRKRAAGRPKNTKLLERAIQETDIWRNRTVSLQGLVEVLISDELVSDRVRFITRDGWYVGLAIAEEEPTP